MKIKIISNLKQFFVNWNGFVLMVPMLALFILTKVAITVFTNGQEQGYFWSHLNVISFGALRLACAEGLASFLLFVNGRDAFKIIFRKLSKEEIALCTFSRQHALQLYCTYLLAAALLMSFL